MMMDADQRKAKFDALKDEYFGKTEIPTILTSERITIYENLHRLHELVEPERIPRARSAGPVEVQPDERQSELGRFRDPRVDRKCISADMNVIRFFREGLGEEPPSFVEAGPRKNLYFDPKKVRVALLTSGGIAPGLNTVVESIVERHVGVYGLVLDPLERGIILGFHDGFVGLEEDHCQKVSPETARGWSRFGGSKLGVGRGSTDAGKWLEVLKKRHVDILYVIGGNGSLTAAWELKKAAEHERLDLSIGVVPKTMDNDILWVWQSFGFATAFDKAAEVINVLHTEAESNRRVCVIQLFGAKSGHVAANAALASGDVDAVLISEEDFELARVCAHVNERVGDYGHAVIVMAEGARGIEHRNGEWVRWQSDTREQRDRNFHRLQKALERALQSVGLGRHQVFGNQPQHTIRSVAPNSHDQVYCRRLADMVVDSCLGGFTGFMVSSWLTEYVLVPLIFSAKNGLTREGYKTFPTGGVFWKTVLRSTGQPPFLSDEVRQMIRAGGVRDEHQ